MHTTTHINPINPFTKNVLRQPKFTARGTTIKGATAAPKLCPAVIDDRPREDSLAGNQREITAELFGKDPASPIPKRNRTIISDINPEVTPVKAVNIDHHNTIRIKAAL